MVFSRVWATFSPYVDVIRHLAVPFTKEIHNRYVLINSLIFSFILSYSPVTSDISMGSLDLQLVLCPERLKEDPEERI